MKVRKRLIQGFIIMFVALLCFPDIKIYDKKSNVEKIARMENRMINPLPISFPWEKTFYSQLEGWFQDRINKRDSLIRYWRGLNACIGVALSKKIFFNDARTWMFSRENFITGIKGKNEKFTAIKQVQEYCTKQDIAFAVAFPPTKEAVYRDLFPKKEQENTWDTLQVEAELQKNVKEYGLNYISLADTVLKSKQKGDHELYFRDDHHWSYYSAELAADEILGYFLGNDYQRANFNKVRKNVYKENSYSNEIDFGQIYGTIAPWSDSFTTNLEVQDCYTGKLLVYNNMISNDYLWEKITTGEGIVYNKKAPINKTMLILGDSYSSYQVPYFSQYLTKVISTHHSVHYAPKKNVDMVELMKKYKPDMVLFQVYSAIFCYNPPTMFENIVIKE